MRGASAHLGAAASDLFDSDSASCDVFSAAWTTKPASGGESKLEAVLYGIILWATLFIGMVWLLNAGIQTGFCGP